MPTSAPLPAGSEPPAGPGPTLEDLFATLPTPPPVPAYEPVPAAAVPEPYRALLVHDEHMTVTMEAHHGSPVEVRVLQRGRRGMWYARQIVLVKEGTDDLVQGGVVRINLDLCAAPVRQAILREDTPLGRILIDHDVMRRIEVTAYLRVASDPHVRRWLRVDHDRPTYARLAYIHTDGRPAIELFEIVRPG
jgi:chorismate-pyruvate lyase